MKNPIIQEVRAAREALAAEFNFDLHRIIADAMMRQGKRPTVNRQSSLTKPPAEAVVANDPPVS